MYGIPCRSTVAGTEYAVMGGLSTTVTGRTCQRWDVQYPHAHGMIAPMFPDSVAIQDINNWCRNPDAVYSGPWCYTTDAVRWQNCDVPFCNGKLFYALLIPLCLQPISCLTFNKICLILENLINVRTIYVITLEQI